MHPEIDKALRRWLAAGVLDAETAERIRVHEAALGSGGSLRWPIRLALAAGALLLCAGVLLFVSAHWDDISPSARFGLVLTLTAIFHVAGAFVAERFAALATALHAVGTVTLGAGIYMAGQIFNLAEHWPGGVMLWGLGAFGGFVLLRDWPQAVLAAILLPIWLASEWAVRAGHHQHPWPIGFMGLTLLAITYLSAEPSGKHTSVRRALSIVGFVTVIPLAAALGADVSRWYRGDAPQPSLSALVFAAGLAIMGPLVIAWLLRGRLAWMNGIAALWVIALMFLAHSTDPGHVPTLVVFLWLALGGVLIMEWGRFEDSSLQRRVGLTGAVVALMICPMWANQTPSDEQGIKALAYVAAFGSAVALAYVGVRRGGKDEVNAAVTLFAVTVLSFYFANVMDRLGRSASLMGFGLLFLVGGFSLERVRRKLVAQAGEWRS